MDTRCVHINACVCLHMYTHMCANDSLHVLCITQCVAVIFSFAQFITQHFLCIP